MEMLHLSPYQTRPLIFNITLGVPLKLQFSVELIYRTHSDSESLRSQLFQVKIRQKSLSETQKVTFLHPAKIVSYAVLLPPPPSPDCGNRQGQKKIPVMVGLHGADLEAEDAQVYEMLDAAYNICTWKLFPTGVTPWAGDDWRESYKNFLFNSLIKGFL